MLRLAAFQRWLHLKQYQLELTFSVYMFTPWEKFAFYSIVFLLFSLLFIASILYFPHHIYFLVGRAWYYINGEHIDVQEAAREAVKEISASVLPDAFQNTATVVAAQGEHVAEAIETVAREL